MQTLVLLTIGDGVNGSSWGRLINGFLENCLPIPHAHDEAWKFYGVVCARNNEQSIYNNE